ncbi:LLM class flavin-dependent oxidoreductase [Leifsonia lichenia]
MELRFGFSMNPSDLGEVRSVARAAEAAGYDRVGIWDSPALYLDPWVTLADVASATSELRIGTWVTNPLTRHPVVTASAAATLDALAPGRVIIGIGTGDSGVYNLAARAAPLDRLSEYVRAVRGLLTEGRAVWEGNELRMRPAANSIPIWVAAHGARAIRVAGAVGDGVIFGLGIAPETIASCRAMLERGASEAGRDADLLDAWYTAPWYVDEDGDAARDAALWHVASLAHHISRSGTVGKFIPERYAAGIVELGEAYNLLSHGAPSREQRDDYRRIARRTGIDEYLVSRYTIAGTPAECASQVLAAAETGAVNHDCANDSPQGDLHRRPNAWASRVLPLLHEHTVLHERNTHV